MLASRFCVLKIDDDSDNQSSDGESSRPKVDKNTNAKKKTNRKKKAANDRAEVAEGVYVHLQLQALAFGTGKSKKKKQAAAKNNAPSQDQWEQWKEKDDAFVEETFEEDMAKAVLLSKIEYEQKSTEPQKPDGKKKKKPVKTVTLETFQQMTPAQVEKLSAGVEVKVGQTKPASPVKPDKNYFNRLEEETREELRREERRRLVRGPRVSSSESGIDKGRVSPSSDQSTSSDLEINPDKERIAELETSLEQERTKIKRLLQVFKDAELKEKGKLVIEADKANKVAAELTTQVADLHVKLEQERSKVHALTDELKKVQDQLQRKRTTSENQ